MKKVVTLTVVHNHYDSLKKLIHSLEQIGFTDAFFCDAASSDGSNELLKNSIFFSHSMFKDKLESFSKNNNDIIRNFGIQAQYYVLLNPDVYFDNDIIADLCDFMDKNEDVGIAAPRLLYPNGEYQGNWKTFPTISTVLKKRIGIRVNAIKKVETAGKIDWALGAFLIVRHELLISPTTLLDERYRLYCEDSDVCFNAKMKGYDVVGLGSVSAFHELQEASSRKIFSKYNYWNILSIIKFAYKWGFSYLKK